MAWSGGEFPQGGLYCTGSIVLDVLTRPVERLPAWGSTQWVNAIEQHLGGNGAAAAFAHGKLGGRVRLAGAVGDDAFGRYALDRLRVAGVDVSQVRVAPGVQTAATAGLINEGGERLFFHHKGAGDVVDLGDLPFDPGSLEGLAFFHLASFFQMARLRAQGVTLLERARAAGLFTSADTVWDPAGRWMDDFGALCPLLDCLFVNHLEAQRLTGAEDPREAAQEFLRRGVGWVVLKRGEDGCAVFGPGGEVFVPAYEVRALDTTGAGDSFCGAFLFALGQGLPPDEAARLANAVAAHCIQQMGGTTGIVGLEATRKFMETARLVAPRIPRPVTIHGETRTDDYFWLRERANPEVIRYLEGETRYTNARMQHTAELQERLYQEMVGRIQETDVSAPERVGEYYYYTKTEEGRQYPIYCRKQGRVEAAEEILLDANLLAAGQPYFRIGAYEPSPDHRLLAYSTDTAGSEVYTLVVKDLATGELRPDQIPNTYYGVEWGNDNRTLFYTTLDAAKRPYRLFRHRLGAEASGELLYEETDERFFLKASKTRSQKYILLRLESKTASEVWYLDAGRPEGAFRVVRRRQPEVEYAVEHHGERFFIVTNEQAKNFKVLEAPVDDPAGRPWKEVLPHRPAVKVDGVAAFREHLAIYERENGMRQIRVRDLATGEMHLVEFPEPVYTVSPSRNPEFDTSVLRFEYNSLVTPRSVFDYDMGTRQRVLQKRYEVRGGYDPSGYETERVFATAPDGARVPLSLVYRRGTLRDGRNPLMLYGYGAYGLSSEPGFSSDRLSLLDRGVIFAIAHVRGGGEMGREWYDQGKLLQKKNTFTDFIAAAEHLIAERYTGPEHLAIYGASAGGLLVGAVTNARPELFRVAVGRVPFVDVINTMLDPSIPLTVTEYEEWGNPNVQQYYEYMRSYSPYDNVGEQEYPDVLLTAGLNDPRVGYWEPAKWTARVRRAKTGPGLVLLRVNMGAGHGGASGRYDRLKETAFEYAFILDRLEVGEEEGHGREGGQ
jgi:oligopeptidase B